MRNLITAILFLAAAGPAVAQTFPTNDPVIKRMWTEGMGEGSQSYRLAQALVDSIGPRLTGTPAHHGAMDWLIKQYAAWGISARKEQYGTWKSWRRGHTYADLLTPRFRTLEARIVGWSPGTRGAVEGDVVLLPDVADSAAFEAWLGAARGKFVMLNMAEPTCRPDENWERLARPATVERMKQERTAARTAWSRRTQAGGRTIYQRLEAAGVAGILSSSWSAGWGVTKVFTANTTRAPVVALSCEDYGLLFRLAQNNQGPRMRLNADAEFLGEKPIFNVVGEIKGSALPNEYVLLSAHFDSYDAASGATDNGTGTVMMMEAMRILKAAYPNPRRTILVGHWAGEEQGLIGSNAFAEDHPEVVAGLQVMFNQDNGTWRVDYIRMMGYAEAGQSFGRWFSKLPNEISDNIRLDIPGVPESGGSDHMAMICRGAPGFRLQSHYPDYRQYTWHTDRDTFDKIIFDDLKNNATLAAMLAYLASEDPQKVSRVKRELNETTEPKQWPNCITPRRSSP